MGAAPCSAEQNGSLKDTKGCRILLKGLVTGTGALTEGMYNLVFHHSQTWSGLSNNPFGVGQTVLLSLVRTCLLNKSEVAIWDTRVSCELYEVLKK